MHTVIALTKKKKKMVILIEKINKLSPCYSRRIIRVVVEETPTALIFREKNLNENNQKKYNIEE
jgi:hypothetical protein